MMGPMARVTGLAKTTFKERLATGGGPPGTKIEVTTPTHLTGAIEFASGAVATVIMSFDVWGHGLPMLQVHGTKGSMDVPDPNTTHGRPRIYKPETKAWEAAPLAYPRTYGEKYGRGVGVADMARAILDGRPHRANGEMALHVVDAMQGFLESGAEGRAIELGTRCERPGRV
jgi:predicted dehydrogenase